MPTRSEVNGADALQETLGALGLGIEVLPPESGRADLAGQRPKWRRSALYTLSRVLMVITRTSDTPSST